MARQPRLQLEGYPFHCIARGNDRQAVFHEERDYAFYLRCLREAALKHGAFVHAYVLMTNHVHMLMTPMQTSALSLVFQSIGRRYVRYINRVYQRTGTLWEGRFKASLVDADEYLLACYRYIELNPVRAGMVRRPEDHRWSSARHNLGLFQDPVITSHDRYLAFAESPDERHVRYRVFLEASVSSEMQKRIADTARAGQVLGGERFQQGLEEQLNRKVRPRKRGRKPAGG